MNDKSNLKKDLNSASENKQEIVDLHFFFLK